MSFVVQNFLPNTTYLTKLNSTNTITINTTHFNPTKTLKLSFFYHQSLQNNAYPLQKNFSLLRNLSHIKVLDSPINLFEEQEKSTQVLNLDAFLSFLESICVVSSVLISVGCFVNWVFFKQHNSGVLLVGNKILVWLLAGAVAVGSAIRRRQWMRVCGSSMRLRPGSKDGNLIARIEELEESMKSATSIIRMLSRQLEKLGIRFRLTRKALMEPITETAALAQKNSEATRALAVQEGILEKELAEVQKVLLAMQDQQQKQLELILAIAKSGKLLETKQAPSRGPGMNKPVSDNGLRLVDTGQATNTGNGSTKGRN